MIGAFQDPVNPLQPTDSMTDLRISRLKEKTVGWVQMVVEINFPKESLWFETLQHVYYRYF